MTRILSTGSTTVVENMVSSLRDIIDRDYAQVLKRKLDDVYKLNGPGSAVAKADRAERDNRQSFIVCTTSYLSWTGVLTRYECRSFWMTSMFLAVIWIACWRIYALPHFSVRISWPRRSLLWKLKSAPWRVCFRNSSPFFGYVEISLARDSRSELYMIGWRWAII